MMMLGIFDPILVDRTKGRIRWTETIGKMKFGMCGGKKSEFTQGFFVVLHAQDKESNFPAVLGNIFDLSKLPKLVAGEWH